MQQVLALDSLDDVRALLASRSEVRARKTLLTAFARFVDYRNAREWNDLVRLCEALAIVGWGEREPVEATCARWVNGAFYTQLSDRLFQQRYLSARWLNHQGTFVLDPSHRVYYASPDRPSHPALSSAEFAAAHPTVDRTDCGVSALASQRNPLPKNPLRLTRAGNYDRAFGPIVKALADLRGRLDRELRPEHYGGDFGYL
ncbi:hypothetical protein OAX78_02555 [Planctomycetota bacterium]|nr:hypothetical protein [Planctomycetota bacterium]